MAKQPVLSLTSEQRQHLRQFAQSRTLPAGDVFKARLILALANGDSYASIQRKLQTSAPVISRWKRRFEEEGLEGLEGRHKGSKVRAATPAVQGKVLKKIQKAPPDGSTHWSCRKMARELGVSGRSLQRRLLSEGSSFSKVLDEARRDRSLELMSRPGAAVAAVAAETGFADAQAFARAFRRWTGLTPSVYRARPRTDGAAEAGDSPA